MVVLMYIHIVIMWVKPISHHLHEKFFPSWLFTRMYFYTSSFTWIEISCVELNYMNETFFLMSTYLTTDFCGWNFHHTYHMNEISPHFCGWNLYHTDYMSKISPLCGILHWLLYILKPIRKKWGGFLTVRRATLGTQILVSAQRHGLALWLFSTAA